MDLPGLTEIAAQVQAWDAPEFWFVSLAALGFSALSFIKAFKGLHRSRLLEDTPTSLVRSASQGYVEFEGTGRRLDGEPVIAPLTGTACPGGPIRSRSARPTGSTRPAIHTGKPSTVAAARRCLSSKTLPVAASSTPKAPRYSPALPRAGAGAVHGQKGTGAGFSVVIAIPRDACMPVTPCSSSAT